MEDEEWQSYSLFLQALRRFSDSLPEEFRHLTLAEAKQAWQDSEAREKLRPAIEELIRSARPFLEEAGAALRAAAAVQARVLQAIRRWQEWVQGLTEAIAGIQRLAAAIPHLAADYCRPWQEQIRQLHGGAVPPLSPEEQRTFMLMGLAMSAWLKQGHPHPPLEWVALGVGRVDIALGVLSERFPDLPKRLLDFREPGQHYQDLQADVLVLLGDRILPGIADRAGELPMPAACEALTNLLTQEYLGAALRRDALDRKRAERRQRRVEGEGLAGVAETLPDPSWMASEEAAAMRAVVDEYLAASDRPQVDRRIVTAIREGTSMDQLGREVGVSGRTLRSRRERLIQWCREQLSADA